jgi:tRNA 2-selenouridine synthase
MATAANAAAQGGMNQRAAPPAASTLFTLQSLHELAQFDAIIDVRSPSEYALDHVPGAVNHPVLNDDERARVGTLYKQVSPFAARRVGAALVNMRIGLMLQEPLFVQERNWRPLVMCWRGGKRSGTLTHMLRQIGWPALQLEGGYRSYRALVNAQLASRPAALRYVVVAGRTGSGKSRILQSLAASGAQVLDLEALARHRGSVLGALPDIEQPSQKWFESQIMQALSVFDPARPVFVESESKKVGNLRVPETLIQTMRSSPCAVIEASDAARTELLLHEYGPLLNNASLMAQQLNCLKALHGTQKINTWIQLCQDQQLTALVQALLHGHYDPAYDRSMQRNFTQLHNAPVFALQGVKPQDFDALAAQLRAAFDTATPFNQAA